MSVQKRESLFGSAASNPEWKTRLQREIEATDRQIDQLVYDLYGLTENVCPLSAQAADRPMLTDKFNGYTQSL